MHEPHAALVTAARAAVAQAFLTKPGGIRYGAAVLSCSGHIFSSGQYSSYNHSTNVHAEQGALVAAAMAGEPDIVALAVASTGREHFTRPCGVCRQVMLEHATRTGRDFEVLMAGRDGGWDTSTASGLLPFSWTARSQDGLATAVMDRSGARLVTPLAPGQRGLKTGDHVLLNSGIIGLVWDPSPWPGGILVKLKYKALTDGCWRKIAHSFSNPIAYEDTLVSLLGHRVAPCGATIANIHQNEVQGVLPRRTIADIPGWFAQALGGLGIPLEDCFVTGSNATGLNTETSDLDMIVRASPQQAAEVRAVVARRLGTGECVVPSMSSTWRLLAAEFPGGLPAILGANRFAETFQSGDRQHVVIFEPKCDPGHVHGSEIIRHGHVALCGVVRESSSALFKRSVFQLETDAGWKLVVVSYLKPANMVRDGDRVALRGWMIEDAGRRILLQLSAVRDNIVWFPVHY